VTIGAAASIAVGHSYRALLSTSGLVADTWAGTGFSGFPVLRSRDSALRTRTVQNKAALVGAPSSTAWHGYLIVPRTAQYRIVIIADDRASFEIDHHRVSGTLAGRGSANIELSRGLHPVRLRYEDEGGRQLLELVWARGTGVPASIPPLYLLPEIRPFQETRARRLLTWAMPGVAIFWSSVILVAAAVAVRRLVGGLTPGRERSFMPVGVAAAGVTQICALWWGLPDL
jgi:hypothetical protein